MVAVPLLSLSELTSAGRLTGPLLDRLGVCAVGDIVALVCIVVVKVVVAEVLVTDLNNGAVVELVVVGEGRRERRRLTRRKTRVLGFVHLDCGGGNRRCCSDSCAGSVRSIGGSDDADSMTKKRCSLLQFKDVSPTILMCCR